jgi:hypothetical protein
MGNFIIQDSGKTKYKMRGRRPDGYITDPRNKGMKESSRRQARTESFLREARVQKGL